jgi:hypothetical protein
MTSSRPIQKSGAPHLAAVKPGDNRLAVATALIAKTRAECAVLGLSPREFADLLLPEALLAMMIDDMTQEEVEGVFARFAREEIAAWFFRIKRVAGYCDCEREAFAEHTLHCSSRRKTAGRVPIIAKGPHQR